MKTLLTTLALIAALAASGTYLVSQYQESAAIYNQANACTAKLVSQGVERSDIIRLKGQCSVR